MDRPRPRRTLSYTRRLSVIPDFLCNAGGVTVTYFEKVQNTYNFYWPIDEVYHAWIRR